MLENCSFLLNKEFYICFEFDLFFKNGRVRIKDTGFNIEEHKVKKNKIFPTFISIEKDKEYETQLKNSLLHTVEHIYKFLNEKSELICTLKEVFLEMSFINQITEKITNEKIINTGWKLN